MKTVTISCRAVNAKMVDLGKEKETPDAEDFPELWAYCTSLGIRPVRILSACRDCMYNYPETLKSMGFSLRDEPDGDTVFDLTIPEAKEPVSTGS